MDYLISVIVPVYNVERYLSQCIDSLITQTYINLEIILVDDGSTDASGRICDQYKKRDSRIHVLHKANGGVSDARNYGLSIATGEYVGFVDSDDIIECDMYEILLKLCIKNHVKLSCTRYDVIEGKFSKSKKHKEKEMVLSSDEFLKYLILGDRNIKIATAVWSRLYHRDIVKNVEFPKGKSFGEEIVFNTKVIINAEKCIYTDKCLYHYRARNESISHSKEGNIFSKNTAFNLVDLYTEQIDFLALCRKKTLKKIACVKAYQHCLKIYSLSEDEEFCKLLWITLNKWKLSFYEIIFLPINFRERLFVLLKMMFPLTFKKIYQILF